MPYPRSFCRHTASLKTEIVPENQTLSESFIFKHNQRTSGPVNAHLTPGPGMYFNAFIYVYSPKAGADNPLGTNVDVNRKPLSLCPVVASFKTISLKYDFKHILNDFIHVYSPRAGQNFDVNRNSLSLCPFITSLKRIFSKSDFLPFFMCVFFFTCIYPQAGPDNPLGTKIYDHRKAFSLCPYVASFKMISSNSKILYTFLMILYMYIAWGKGR